MKKQRVPETDHGIIGETSVRDYDEMQRKLKNKGWIATESLILSGINSGLALEIGPGPGYLGLEWLKNTDKTRLKGAEISPDMKHLAEKNAAEYGLTERTEYVLCDAAKMPFGDDTFDGIFTSGSMHEWSRPDLIFNEIYRVIKPGGRFYIGDLRRDMPFLMKAMMYLGTRPKKIRPFLISSINAAYTGPEMEKMLSNSRWSEYKVVTDRARLVITGTKNK